MPTFLYYENDITYRAAYSIPIQFERHSNVFKNKYIVYSK